MLSLPEGLLRPSSEHLLTRNLPKLLGYSPCGGHSQGLACQRTHRLRGCSLLPLPEEKWGSRGGGVHQESQGEAPGSTETSLRIWPV